MLSKICLIALFLSFLSNNLSFAPNRIFVKRINSPHFSATTESESDRLPSTITEEPTKTATAAKLEDENDSEKDDDIDYTQFDDSTLGESIENTVKQLMNEGAPREPEIPPVEKFQMMYRVSHPVY
jgi:hypothetical protein